MSIFNITNIGIIAAMVILIQLIKIKILKNKVKGNIWYYIIIGASLLATVLVTDFAKFDLQNFIHNIFLYSAGSIFLYVSGKIGFKNIIIKRKNEE